MSSFVKNSFSPLDAEPNCEKYQDSLYANPKAVTDWQAPQRVIYPFSDKEKSALGDAYRIFSDLQGYTAAEADAAKQNTIISMQNPVGDLVSTSNPLTDGYVLFLEACHPSIRCTSPQTKTDAKALHPHWLQRAGTPVEMFDRLLKGYSISMMAGERYKDRIRNRINWYLSYGMEFDVDEFRTPEKMDLPEPVYSYPALFEKYPIFERIGAFFMPSPTSLWDGRYAKGRLLVLFPQPISDQRVFRQLAKIFIDDHKIDCIPRTVTATIHAVCYGAAHQAGEKWQNPSIDFAFLQSVIAEAEQRVIQTSTEKLTTAHAKGPKRDVKGKAVNSWEHGQILLSFCEDTDAIAALSPWMPHITGNTFGWYSRANPSEKALEAYPDGGMKMWAGTPAKELAPILSPDMNTNTHRAFAFLKYGLDMTLGKDVPELCQRLVADGYAKRPTPRPPRTEPDTEKTPQHLRKSQPPILTPEQDREVVERLIAQAPPPHLNQPPSYRHFLPEDRQLIRACGFDPEASYTEHATGRKPVWIPKYDKLYDATGQFQLNGQPKHVETYRVWNTLFQTCPECYTQTQAFWIDRFHLTAGTYCDKCHKDETLNSTLALELRRELPNAYKSDFDGFIGNDPFWKEKETPLWKAGRLTHLGAAMALGKTTLIQQTGCEIAPRDDKFFIICVPRISLALNIAYKLNRQYGEGAFGIYYESSRYKQHGRIGAVCTLTSLPLIFQGEWNDLEPKDCLIFIDELDFSYPLNELVTRQAKKVKRILRQSLHANGLVTAGQTEYTAVIEAFADEMETDDAFGYYKSAQEHDGLLQWVEYPDIDGKEIMLAAGAAKSIQTGLDAADVVHAFTSERRQAEVMQKMFEHENPLVYTSLTKHTPRCKQLLYDRKLTDTRLLIATSAADVGISIEDYRDTRTIIASTLLYGRIPVETMIQETARVRGTPLIEIHVPRYQTALPLKPTETKNVFQQSLALKREIAAIEDDDFLIESRIATKKALVNTLRELAEQQPLTFCQHHLHDVAGYQIAPTEYAPVKTSQLNEIRILKKQTQQVEKAESLKYAIQVIDAEIERSQQMKQNPYEYLPAQLQSSSEIRQAAADGHITAFNLLGQKHVNELAVVIGFDDLSDRIRSGDPQQPVPFQWKDADLPCIQAMVNAGIDASVLTLQIQGYIAALDTAWTQQHTESDLLEKEWTAVTDYRGIGRLARHLCEKLQGTVWRADAFASAIHDTLHAETPSGTLLSDIKSGAMGGAIYKKGRFLFKSDDFGGATSQHGQLYADFAISVLESYLPVKVRRQTLNRTETETKNAYFTLTDSNTIDVFEKALNCYLAHNVRDEKTAKWHAVNRIGKPETEKQKRETEAVRLKRDGKNVREIAEDTGLSVGAVSKATKGVKPTKRKNAERDAEIIRLHTEGKSQREINNILTKLGYKVSTSTIGRVVRGCAKMFTKN